ncbi:hypothetical protein [Streptomyces sp. NPDC058308]|uniref:hypothetical protein n=1 Tax=Streptomyces sp. NPDC058308 TaxID=3346440 RepID=UPI0036E9C97A
MPKEGASRAARRRTWLTASLVGVLLVASSVTWIAVSRAADREDRFAANQEQLTRACAGLLPDALRSFVPDDERGVLDEFGTMLRPRQPSRALLDCSLSWGGGGDAWEPDARARVRAEAVLTRTPPDEVTGDFGLSLPESAMGAVGSDDRLHGSAVTASLLVDCPNGLSGRVRSARDLLVSVELPSEAEEYHVPKADKRLAARTAMRVADWVTGKQGCGGEPLGTGGAPASAKAPKLCAWLSPEELRLTPGKWSFAGSDTAYSRRAGECAGRWDDTLGSPGDLTIKAAGAQSWSGVLAAGAYDRYQDGAQVPDPKAPSTVGRPVTVERSGDGPELALWARSECVAGPTYHRVTVMPEFDADSTLEDDTLVLERADQRRISQRARAVLDRYLKAPDGWPRRAHCRDTKVMGEVARWHG